MTKTIKQLQKEANAAPKYALKVEGLNLFLADFQGLSGVNLTAIPKKAMKYSIGFDNPTMKLSVWNAAASVQFNNSDVKFEVVNL